MTWGREAPATCLRTWFSSCSPACRSTTSPHAAWCPPAGAASPTSRRLGLLHPELSAQPLPRRLRLHERLATEDIIGLLVVRARLPRASHTETIFGIPLWKGLYGASTACPKLGLSSSTATVAKIKKVIEDLDEKEKENCDASGAGEAASMTPRAPR